MYSVRGLGRLTSDSRGVTPSIPVVFSPSPCPPSFERIPRTWLQTKPYPYSTDPRYRGFALCVELSKLRCKRGKTTTSQASHRFINLANVVIRRHPVGIDPIIKGGTMFEENKYKLQIYAWTENLPESASHNLRAARHWELDSPDKA